AVLPASQRGNFERRFPPRSINLIGATVRVSGVVEVLDQKPQILIFDASQIEIVPELIPGSAAPPSPLALEEEADELAAGRNLMGAETKYGEELELNKKSWPNDPVRWIDTLSALADVRARAGRWKEAAADYTRLTELQPT